MARHFPLIPLVLFMIFPSIQQCWASAQEGSKENIFDTLFFDPQTHEYVTVCRVGKDGTLYVRWTCGFSPKPRVARKRPDLIAIVNEVDGIKANESYVLVSGGKPEHWIYGPVDMAYENHQVRIVELSVSKFKNPTYHTVSTAEIVQPVAQAGGWRSGATACFKPEGKRRFSSGEPVEILSLFPNGLAVVKSKRFFNHLKPAWMAPLSSDNLVPIRALGSCSDDSPQGAQENQAMTKRLESSESRDWSLTQNPVSGSAR